MIKGFLISVFIASVTCCFAQVTPQTDSTKIKIDSSYQQRINKTPMDTSALPLNIPPPSGNPGSPVDSTLHKKNIDDQDPKKVPKK